MKRILLSLSSVLLLTFVLMTTSCSTLSSRNALTKQSTLNKEKIQLASELTYQIAHTTNNTPLTKAYIDKLENLVGEPDLALTHVTNFDKQIEKLQSAEDKNQLSIEESADKEGQLQLELNKYHKWFGLEAIVLGIIQFIKSSIWVILGFGVLFLLLRALAATNPLCNIIFGIFQSLAAGVMHIIESMVPASINVINQAKVDVTKVEAVVDSVQHQILPPPTAKTPVAASQAPTAPILTSNNNNNNTSL